MLDWGQTSKEEIYAKNDPFYTYFAAKLLAEKALWEFAKTRPHLDITSSTNTWCTLLFHK